MKKSSRLLLRLCFLSAVGLSSTAQADDWGCEVLLCLSNPAGPTAVSQCVSPIRKLWRELARGHAFPTCLMDNGQGQTAKNEWASVNNCPPGYLTQDSNGDAVCLMRGVVTVTVNGTSQSRIWWSDSDSIPAVQEDAFPITPAPSILSPAARKFEQ